MKRYIGIGSMIISGLFFGGVWFFSKMIVQDIAPMLFTTLRLGIAAIISLLLGWKYIPQLLNGGITKREWKYICIASLIGFGGGAMCFTLSVKWTTITNASFLFFLPSVVYPVFSSFFGKIGLKWTTYVAVVLCVLGLYSLFDPEIIGTSMIGNVLALLAGSFNLIYMVSIKQVGYLPSRMLSVAVFGLIMCFLIFFTALFEGLNISSIQYDTWQLLLYLGGCVAGAYLFLNTGLKYISSYLAGILVIWEPLAATALGFLFLGEIITTSAMFGLIAILCGFGLIHLDKHLLDT